MGLEQGKRPGAGATGLRANQRLRTRKDMLAAAARLLQRDVVPTIDEVAEEALVSRATAYRYFPSIDALLIEAPLDAEVPAPEEFFAEVTTDDPEERVDLAEAALHEMAYRNAAQLRRMLASSLSAAPGDGPVRQNRRLGLIEAALAPVRGRLNDATYTRLCAGLALVFGTESMVVLSDVHPTPPDEARRIKSWVVCALVRAALAEDESRPASGGPASSARPGSSSL